MRGYFVTFYSPGTLFAETSTLAIESWDIKTAVGLSANIRERYDAKPYGFRFETHLVAEPVPDGEGGLLDVRPRKVAESGMHFLGGHLVTYDEVLARNDPKEEILRSNMRGQWPIVCVNDNSWRTVVQFQEADVLLNAQGDVVARGNDPTYVEYRKLHGEQELAKLGGGYA